MHQAFDLIIRHLNRKQSNGASQSSLRDMPEVLVPVHESSQPGVFELFLSPELRKTIEVARDTGATVPYNRVNIEQRSVSIEYQCSGV